MCGLCPDRRSTCPCVHFRTDVARSCPIDLQRAGLLHGSVGGWTYARRKRHDINVYNSASAGFGVVRPLAPSRVLLHYRSKLCFSLPRLVRLPRWSLAHPPTLQLRHCYPFHDRQRLHEPSKKRMLLLQPRHLTRCCLCLHPTQSLLVRVPSIRVPRTWNPLSGDGIAISTSLSFFCYFKSLASLCWSLVSWRFSHR